MGETDRIQRTMEQLRGVLRRPAEHLRRVVYPLRLQFFRDAFESAGLSTGRPWAQLEPKYAALQMAVNDSLVPLEATNPVLEPSFQGGPSHVMRLQQSMLEVGSRLPYATHVAEGGTNPLTGEPFPGRDPRPLSRSQIERMTTELLRSITREAFA